MAYHPIEELLPRAGFSIYRLVRMAARRANELADGQKPLVDRGNVEKETTLALEEIAQGKVVYKGVVDAVNAGKKQSGKT